MSLSEKLRVFLRNYGGENDVLAGLQRWVADGKSGVELAAAARVSRYVVSGVRREYGFTFPKLHRNPAGLVLHKPPTDFMVAITKAQRDNPEIPLREVIDAVMKSFHETPRWKTRDDVKVAGRDEESAA